MAHCLRLLERAYGVRPTGIVHVGANTGQEVPVYRASGIRPVVLVEPLAGAFANLVRAVGGEPGFYPLKICLSDVADRKVEFHVASNGGLSSSYLRPAALLRIRPDITFDRTETMVTETLDGAIDSLCRAHGLRPESLDYIGLDTQGTELDILNGGAAALERAKYVFTEVSFGDIYEADAGLYQMIESMRDWGFDLYHIAMKASGWGDALFMRRAAVGPGAEAIQLRRRARARRRASRRLRSAAAGEGDAGPGDPAASGGGHAARKTFLAARRDGFGERLRALINAMILADRFDGDFRFVWEESREADRAANAILPKAETFAPDFLAEHAVAPGGGARPFRGYSRIAGAASIETGERFRVEQHDLADVLPEAATALPAAGAAAFRRIRFSDRLERGRRAAFDLDLPEGAAAIHLRAGDLLYGQHRLVGHFASKAMAWPLAFGLAAQLRSEGRAVLVFGQDRALCRHLAAGQGGVFAGDVAADRGLDLYQSVLFEIALMSRCAEIHAGASGFALAACQIAGTAPARAESRLGPDAIRALFLRALDAPAEAAISDLQRAFAFWSAAFVHAGLFDAAERGRFLAAASGLDPDNCLYRLAHVGARLEAGETEAAAAALAALVETEAERADGTLRFVLAKRRASGRSTAGRIVEGFARLARRDHVGAHLCLALGAGDPARARASAARFLKLRPAGLAGYDPDVRRVLASA